jgi:ribosomal protein S18 acetylase RimI-like enzyme
VEDPSIRQGIPSELIDEAARLLMEAFAMKVEHELRPRMPDQALRLIAGSMDPSLGWVALDRENGVVGVIGVGMRGRRFSHMDYRGLAREFGHPGAIPRWALAACEELLARPKKRQWRVEVLGVDEATRGRGVGTALLATVIEAAREAGMHTVGLEVVDVNERALRLYQRIGFRQVFSLPTGWLTARGGYRGVRFMVLDLRGDATPA